jgi:hypothetical protein
VLAILSGFRAASARDSSGRIGESHRRTVIKRRLGAAASRLAAALMCLTLLAGYAFGKGELGEKEARRLIARFAGIELGSSAVRIRAITQGAADVTATAQIETAFRFERGDDERWRISEIRTGSDRWEDLSLIAHALALETPAGAAGDDPEKLLRARAQGELDASRAREMIAQLAGIELPSDAVRVREISALYKSALVVARVSAEFRLVKDSNNKWRVAGIRRIGGDWTETDALVGMVNREKARRARTELKMIAVALDTFRRERGFYVVADDVRALIDQLNPHYLAHVIRLDPWRNPYLYEGAESGFVLRSAGADGEPNTTDDIRLMSHTQAVESAGP